MKLLVLSDLHHSITAEQQALLDSLTPSVDLILSLGDTPVETIRRVDLGVLGNHDPLGGIAPEKDLHLSVRVVEGYTLTGFSGSVRYKDGDYNMYTQDEACKLQIPKADILVSHDSSDFGRDSQDDVHCGFKALTDYIQLFQPLLHLHGHQHESGVYRIGATTCVSVYKCCLVTICDVEGISVEYLF